MRTLLLLLLAAALGGCTDEDFAPTATCENPAALQGTYDPAAPGYFIVLRAEVDVDAEVPRLQRTYQFTVKNKYAERTLFTETLADAQRDMLRCDPAVHSMQYNGIVTF